MRHTRQSSGQHLARHWENRHRRKTGKMQNQKTPEVVMKPRDELLRSPSHPFETFALSKVELQFVGEISPFLKLFTWIPGSMFRRRYMCVSCSVSIVQIQKQFQTLNAQWWSRSRISTFSVLLPTFDHIHIITLLRLHSPTSRSISSVLSRTSAGPPVTV
jgi:hypothetical protein